MTDTNTDQVLLTRVHLATFTSATDRDDINIRYAEPGASPVDTDETCIPVSIVRKWGHNPYDSNACPTCPGNIKTQVQANTWWADNDADIK